MYLTTNNNSVAMASEGIPVLLVTIYFSHYTEAARWGMESRNVDFEESAWLPGFHGFSGVKGVREAAGVEGKDMLPAVLSGDKRTIIANDSWSCLEKYAGKVDDDIKKVLNDTVGTAARTIAYSYLLTEEGDGEFASMLAACRPCGWFSRTLLGISQVRGKVAERIRSGYVRNDDYVKSARERLTTALEEIESRLTSPPFVSEKGEDDEVPTATAIALSALMYPLIMPEKILVRMFGEASSKRLNDIRSQAFKEEIEHWRNTNVGRFVLDTYEKRENAVSR